MSLNLSQKDFNYIFASMEDGICVMDKKGILRFANISAKELFGIPEEVPDEQKIWKYIPYTEKNDDLIQMFIDSSNEKMSNHEGFVDYENEAGKIFKLRISMTATKLSNDETMYIAIISDLTEFIRVNMAFARYTSRDIAEYVLHNPEGELLGGQQRECTIMMSDLRGFTALSTRLTPSELIIVLNHYFEAMVSIIEKHGGSVIEFLGDGIFVVFGAPKEDEEHALNCVKCAVEMQNAMSSINKWNEENGYPLLEMGIGINSGKVVVGNIGSHQKTKYGCMGENVNLAGRVESYTVGGQIYISEHTANRINEHLDIAGKDSFMPKGAKSEVTIYDIWGVGDTHIESVNTIKAWMNMQKEVRVPFYKLEGKCVTEGKYEGQIIALSNDRKCAKLVVETTFADRQNIMLDIGGDLYAKVIEQKEDYYILRFTSTPEHFNEWVEERI